MARKRDELPFFGVPLGNRDPRERGLWLAMGHKKRPKDPNKQGCLFVILAGGAMLGAIGMLVRDLFA